MQVELLTDAFVALLAAIGLAQLLWMAVSTVAGPKRQRMDHVAAVVPASGAGAGLEQTVRTLLQLRRETGGFRRIVMLDCGLGQEGRMVASLLAREDRAVALCCPEELRETLLGA